MDKLFKIIQNAKKLSDESVFVAIMETQNATGEVNELIADAQMYEQGIDGEGNEIGQYAESTKKIKQRKGQRFDHITLRDTEEFHNSIRVGQVTNEAANVSANPIKSDGTNLLLKYGTDILELTEANTNELSTRLIPEAEKHVRFTLGIS